MRAARLFKSHPWVTLHWACVRLSSFPDPSKPVWDQDMKILDILMAVDQEMNRK